MNPHEKSFPHDVGHYPKAEPLHDQSQERVIIKKNLTEKSKVEGYYNQIDDRD
jgi:hypothetical protein